MLFRSSMGTPVSRHRANNRRRTRGTRGTSTRGRGRDRGAQRASSSTRVITQVLHDDDDDFMPPRSPRPANSSNHRNTEGTSGTTISANDDDDDFMPTRPRPWLQQSSSEDADDDGHLDHIFPEFAAEAALPPLPPSFNYEQWKSMNRNFPFRPFY